MVTHEAKKLKVKKIHSKSILSRSQVYDYVVNPYVGCQHGCSYCYATFMRRFTGHKESWGDFVDVKINAPTLLKKEITKKKRGTVWVSGVTDPYQPFEKKYELTRQCLEILVEHDWPVIVQTRSPLVLRDIDVFKQSESVEVGLSVTTANDEIRKAFEPHAPSIESRLNAIASLRENGIRTYAMIAPILPEAEQLVTMLEGKVDYIIIDRMNYRHSDAVYRQHGWQASNTDEYFDQVKRRMLDDCAQSGIDCRLAY